ncbi:hypothetical protein [Aquicella lusitana]|uniref:DUF4189 domain-containing protein n=1 Tax=Aquicella lusitana TaxID=254246 RepID=A0A370GDS6_9COXI|nr:hypothetical protein [Aquicella lusitana]RDI41841.1 hypothetical protein C8D86_11758 [Aquicella lusitana]VVC73749.1 hypothetical protein AQULUS_14980 [Aquicella lusitana]
MKTVLAKIAFTALLCTFVITAHAAWRCQATNSMGQSWYAIAKSSNASAAIAMKACKLNTHYTRSCRLDYCTYAHKSKIYRPLWQCNIMNSKGQAWYGVGSTKADAYAVGMKYCLRYSSRYSCPTSCDVLSCFKRQ